MTFAVECVLKGQLSIYCQHTIVWSRIYWSAAGSRSEICLFLYCSHLKRRKIPSKNCIWFCLIKNVLFNISCVSDLLSERRQSTLFLFLSFFISQLFCWQVMVTSQPVSCICPCSPLPSGTWRTPRPVHFLTLSSHLFFCLLRLLPSFTRLCKMVLPRPDARETCPYRQFASLYDDQEVLVWSDCLLDLGT